MGQNTQNCKIAEIFERPARANVFRKLSFRCAHRIQHPKMHLTSGSVSAISTKKRKPDQPNDYAAAKLRANLAYAFYF